MTLKEWYEFNKSVFTRMNYELCILKRGSFNKKDQILKINIYDLETVILFFEDKDLELKSVALDTRESGLTLVPFVRMILWPKEV